MLLERLALESGVSVGVSGPHHQHPGIERRIVLTHGDHSLEQVHRAPGVHVHRVRSEAACQGAGGEARQVIDPFRKGRGHDAVEGVVVTDVSGLPLDGRNVRGRERRSAGRKIAHRRGHGEPLLE